MDPTPTSAAPTSGTAIALSPGEPRLELRGRIDIFVAEPLHAAAVTLLQRPGGEATVDLAGATHLDGSALQVLVALARALRAAGRGVALAGAGHLLDPDAAASALAAELGGARAAAT
ncbi:MAG TPA: STAS domain-containing protein, partial [Planctomycetota bacterium]|nr:STAS domain-containing protein [Planctomycetota bacterium]